MDGDKRRDHRQPLKYPAKIDLGDERPHIPCLMTDVSASGVRVIVEGASAFPDRLNLLLAPEHGAMRRCKVVWREQNELGLEFIKPPVEKPASRERRSLR